MGDIPKPSLPSILPKKPLPPKSSSSSSSSSSHPPRRPERPPSLASVHKHTLANKNTPPRSPGRVHEANVVVWFTCSAVRAQSLRAGPPHQTPPLTGHMTLVSLTGEAGTWRLGDPRARRPCTFTRLLIFFLFFFCRCVCSDVDLDAVVSSTERLSHPTASRPRVMDRRPRSQIIAPVSPSPSFSAVILRITKTMTWKGVGSELSPCPACLPQSSLSSFNLDSPVEDKREKDRVKEDPESTSRSVDTSLRKGVPTISVRPRCTFCSVHKGATDPRFSRV